MRIRALATAAIVAAGLLVPAGAASAYCADLSPVDPCFNHCEVLHEVGYPRPCPR